MSHRLIDYQLLFAYENKDRQEINELKAIGASDSMRVWCEESKISALMLAFLYNDITAAKVLLKMGADINLQDKNGETPLMYAVREKNVSAVKLCLQNGSKIDIQNNNGETACDIARYMDCSQTVKILSEQEKTVKQARQVAQHSTASIQKNIRRKGKEQCR